MFQSLSSLVTSFKNMLGAEQISDQLSDSSEVLEEKIQDFDDANLTLDAAVQGEASILHVDLQESDLLQICYELEEKEIVSLIFLLCNSPHQALHLMEKGFKNNLNNTILELAEPDVNWEKKLCESLCLIQNYKILHELGYHKDVMIQTYQPHHIYVENYISKYKKALYYLCEELTVSETLTLIQLVKAKLGSDRFKKFSKHYLEIYLLHWETIDYDMTNILSHVKQMNLIELKEKLSLVIKPKPEIKQSIPFISNKIDETLQKKESNRKILDAAQPNSFTSLNSNQSSFQQDTATFSAVLERYEIDPDNPGVCLIFNQQEFHKEFEQQYKELLSKEPLSSRKGSEIDYAKLQKTFTLFNFKLVLHENKTHIDMLMIIKETVANITDESSFFLVILSHGEKDIVYGANSCKVYVKEIQDIMCKINKKYTQSKPKVLIIQSCQGNSVQQLTNEDEDIDTEFETDGGNQAVPTSVDLLTFWATIPGFAAIRHEKQGTWFIQSLCDAMIQFGNQMHFQDICTKIVNNVSSKKWKDKVMTPIYAATFRKALYLPCKRQ